jgi:hypothetical protein
MLDPEAAVRRAQWGTAITTLRQLDPSNPQLSSITSPNWVPSNPDIAALNAEIGHAATRRVTNFVMPNGNPIGRPGGNVDVRTVEGGREAAQNAFNYLSVGGTPYIGSYPGTMVTLPPARDRLG